MKFVVTNAQMKAAEAECNAAFISYSEMMNNAGNAVAERIIAEHKPCTAAVFCGAGNNGGDGFVIAMRLLEKGFNTRVILVNGAPRTDCALEYFHKLSKERVWSFSEDEQNCTAFVNNAELVVDCVFGTGFHGALPEHVARLFGTANGRPARIAVDVPSGMNSDTGEFDPDCFKPTCTYVLAAFKKGMLVPAAMELLGNFETLNIGINAGCFKSVEAVFNSEIMRRALPRRSRTSHKGTFGRLLNIAGSLSYSGAAVMSTRAALRSGVGLCTLAAPVSVVKALTGTLVENTFLPLHETEDGFISEYACEAIAEILPKMTAVSIGCGLGNNENTRKLTEFVIKHADCPIIIDADGINSIACNINILKERTGDKRNIIITPHPLEFSRISGLTVDAIQSDRIGAAKSFAEEYGVTVLLKGAYSVIADPSGKVTVNSSGNSALAKGGSGDVLTGIIAAMLAQGLPPHVAASAGAYCHGYAAELLVAAELADAITETRSNGRLADMPTEKMSPASVIASDIIEVLPQVFI